MVFLYPLFLFALFAVAIPIIIHLFNFRSYKTVFFSDIRFLQNLKQETRSKSQLKHLLILLFRMLAIASLVFAFSQPFIPVKGKKTAIDEKTIGLYIDNSFSMDAAGKYGNLFEEAKSKARSIVNAHQLSARYYFLSNDFEAKHQHLISKEQAEEFIGNVKVSPVSASISEVIKKFNEYNNREDPGLSPGRNNLYVISDFQKIFADFSSIKNDTSSEVILVPLATQPTGNLYIDSCWFESPVRLIGQADSLMVRIVNNSKEKVKDLAVELIFNHVVKAIGSVTLEANSNQTISLNFSDLQPGYFSGKVQINDNPVTYDNSLYLSYAIANKINILAIYESTDNQYIKALFSDDNYFNLTEFPASNIQNNEFNKFQVIFLNNVKTISSGLIQEFSNFAKNGGTLVIFPSFDADITSYNHLLELCQSNTIISKDTSKTAIEKIDYGNILFRNAFKKIEKNLDLPLVNQHFRFNNLSRSNEKMVLSTGDNQKILSIAPVGKGRLFSFAFPLTAKSGNFQKHPLFVPTLYNIAVTSQSANPLYFITGRNNSLVLNSLNIDKTEIVHIINQENKIDFIPQLQPEAFSSAVRLNVTKDLNLAGNYIISSGKQTHGVISFNYDRRESDLNFYSVQEINEILKKNDLTSLSVLSADNNVLTKQIIENRKGTPLWKYFILMALLFFAAEIALIRLIRN